MALAVVLREEIPVPEGVEVTIDKEVTVKGPKGELKRKFKQGNVTIKQEDSMVVLETRFPKKKDKAMLGTIKSHISNMIQGLTEGFTYRMKIVYAHFPHDGSPTPRSEAARKVAPSLAGPAAFLHRAEPLPPRDAILYSRQSLLLYGVDGASGAGGDRVLLSLIGCHRACASGRFPWISSTRTA